MMFTLHRGLTSENLLHMGSYNSHELTVSSVVDIIMLFGKVIGLELDCLAQHLIIWSDTQLAWCTSGVTDQWRSAGNSFSSWDAREAVSRLKNLSHKSTAFPRASEILAL
ncbi:Tyrosinase family protein asqI [Clarias magur]|uniref:Tyrosinase family protein asqI n=1 Tax=Clarias magur TaxID=1594786 RepID=A0A8J4UN95_CLAMG|nr:Tyrosinase family protein asqI [Clarias magur]